MSTPTLEQMKTRVAEMLPDKINILGGAVRFIFCWKNNVEIRETEWREVCALAEETLTNGEWGAYPNALLRFLPPNRTREFITSKDWITLPVETRLPALCLVRNPKLFKP